MVKVLLCDDESIQRAALRVCIERLSGLPLSIGEIREAAHGRQAVELCAAWRPDIVFLDLRMPVMGGLEAAAAIRQAAPETQIVILTAYDEFNFAQEAIQIGVEDYLLKPAGQQDLTRVLQKTMQAIVQRQAQADLLASLRRRLEQARPLIQQEYTNDLLTGRKLSPQVLEEKRRFLGLSEHPRQVMLVELDDFVQVTAERSEESRQMLKEQAWMIVEREARPPALLHRLGGDRLAVLLPDLTPAAADDVQQAALELAEHLHRAVSRELQLALTIGLGRTAGTPADLHQSFHDAVQAVGYKSVLGGNHVIHINDVDQSAAGPTLPAEEELLQQAVRLGDQRQALSLLPPLLDLLERQELGRLELLEWRMIELLVLTTRAAILGGANLQQATLANVCHLRNLTQATSVQELRQIVAQAVAELLQLVLAERNLRHQRLIERAVQHMQQHYARPLALEDLARLVFLSPFYFSHVFKEQTGMTFVEYLTDLRLCAAKQLLRETLLPIGQIAEQVGYSDVNYFSRVFKKQVSLTPTEYRRRMAGAERER